jgi:hypothetical protein
MKQRSRFPQHIATGGKEVFERIGRFSKNWALEFGKKQEAI